MPHTVPKLQTEHTKAVLLRRDLFRWGENAPGSADSIIIPQFY